ncbi:Aste57867_23956 [Aphanomyces stellatus]|uniref:Aste57867_23956 protein n=1 Tax=Aphanomyces stellatus TaxID=120398 RepID=A0A485LQ78_9STRA|nr:hypothetical protein As57867_023883 [Aphanomyces stellatus]VFU00599.1 Aste57867_23956 [Aphanomyces stellatus]
MEKKSRQPVHEGYLQWLPATAGALQVQYCQLSWSCQLRMFPNETTAESGAGGTPFSIRAFGKWEGRGVLPLDSYGLELQLKDKKSIFVAAENRLDLDRWCRALVAVLDPMSDAAEEIKRERRKVKREIRKQAEKEAELKAQEEEFKRKWIAQKKQELRDRELEIELMTPLERKDGLGTLDEETEAILRDRKKRLNKKAGQNVGRVGKQMQRRRLELLAGGKAVNEDTSFGIPDPNTTITRKAKVKIDLPPPGQYFVAVTDRVDVAIDRRSAGRHSVSSQESNAMFEDDGGFSTDDNATPPARSRGGAAPPPPPPPPPPLARPPNMQPPAAAPHNPMAAALEAIKMNRRYSSAASAIGDDEDEREYVPPPRKQSSVRAGRTREKQLSAEGKSMLARALSGGTLHKAAPPTTNGRKGLFDSSDESDDDDDALEQPEVEAAPTARPDQLRLPTSNNLPGPTTSVAATITVVFLSSAVELRQGKSVAVYSFAFQLPSPLEPCRFGYSYHEMEAIHGSLKVGFPDGLPKFPSKHLLRNPTKPENMQKRASEFLVYFQALTAMPAVVRHPSFHAAFRVPPEWIPCLMSGQVVQSGGGRQQPPPAGAAVRPTAMAPLPRKPGTTTQPSKKNLFDDDSSDDDDDDLEASAVSVETPEPVFAKKKAAAATRLERTLSASSRASDVSMERRPSSASMLQKQERAASKKSIQADERPPSRKQAAEQAAPAITGLPTRPNLFGGGRGDLLAAIRQGAQLNKVSQDDPATDTASAVAPPATRAPPPANSLLAALQHAAPLKKTTTTAATAAPKPVLPPRAPSIHDSIANAMAARQLHTQYCDKSDDGSDDEWDD